MPLVGSKKAIARVLYKPKVKAQHVVRYTIHEIRCIQKYGGDILLQLRFKLCIEPLALFG